MKYELFYVGNVDFSDYVNTRKYSINREDVIETWTDANKVVHSTVVRQKVQGNITLLFKNATQYNNFVSVLSSNKTVEGKYSIGVHVNNEATTNLVERFDAFIEFEAKVVYTTDEYERQPALMQVECSITEE